MRYLAIWKEVKNCMPFFLVATFLVMVVALSVVSLAFLLFRRWL